MKTFLRLFLSATLFAAASPLPAQASADWREYIRQMVEDGMDDDAATAFYEDLSDLESHPLNINDVSLADLERLPFLSGEQQHSILQFLEKNRPVYSVYELRNVPLLDVQTVQLLLPFFVVGEYQPQKPKLSWKNIFGGGKHELQSRYDRVFPQRAGYKSVPDSILKKSPNRVYQGEDFYQSLRYAYKAGRRFQAGITAEKDAGETFFRGEHKGYDHYGAFVQLKDVGRLKALVVGDYRMRWGQGLLLNNNFFGRQIVANRFGGARHGFAHSPRFHSREWLFSRSSCHLPSGQCGIYRLLFAPKGRCQLLERQYDNLLQNGWAASHVARNIETKQRYRAGGRRKCALRVEGAAIGHELRV